MPREVADDADLPLLPRGVDAARAPWASLRVRARRAPMRPVLSWVGGRVCCEWLVSRAVACCLLVARRRRRRFLHCFTSQIASSRLPRLLPRLSALPSAVHSLLWAWNVVVFGVNVIEHVLPSELV